VIERWIDVGQPDEKLIAKRAPRATGLIYSYGGRDAGKWWHRVGPAVERCENLTVHHVAPDT
jgi:uncharacterized protein YaeQ